MAKKPEAAPAKTSTKSISRQRRSAMERKSLSKSAKRMFKGATKTLFSAVLAAEKVAKKKPSLSIAD